VKCGGIKEEAIFIPHLCNSTYITVLTITTAGRNFLYSLCAFIRTQVNITHICNLVATLFPNQISTHGQETDVGKFLMSLIKMIIIRRIANAFCVDTKHFIIVLDKNCK
jgi:hypothetical protein